MEVSMLWIYQALLTLHILSAVAALAAFWTAAVVKKGSDRHVRVGQIYVFTMVSMSVTALGLSALNIAAPTTVHSLDEFRARGAVVGGKMAAAELGDLARDFRLNAVWLTYAAFQLLIGLRFGTRVVRERRVGGVRLRLDTALAALVVAGGLGLTVGGTLVAHPLITAFGVMGAFSGARRLVVLVRRDPSPMTWWYEHMLTMLGTGVPLHVTFLLALGRHLPGPSGSWRVALSGIVMFGLPAILIWIRHYRRKFETGSASDPASNHGRTPQPV
jgi:uncharacterized membrane protein